RPGAAALPGGSAGGGRRAGGRGGGRVLPFGLALGAREPGAPSRGLPRAKLRRLVARVVAPSRAPARTLGREPQALDRGQEAGAELAAEGVPLLDSLARLVTEGLAVEVHLFRLLQPLLHHREGDLGM